MRNKIFLPVAALIFAMGFVFAANAATDVTSSIQYLFAPNQDRWGTSSNNTESCVVRCLDSLQGRIYTAGGDYNRNTGPVPIYSINPYGSNPTYRCEYTAGTEQLESLKQFSDGRIWARATDPREDGNVLCGGLWYKEDGGKWNKIGLGQMSAGNFYRMYNQNPTNFPNKGYRNLWTYVHVWDFCEWKSNLFMCGYGIGKSNWTSTDRGISNTMTDAYYTIDPYEGVIVYKNGVDSSMVGLRRWTTLLPFDNALYSFPYFYWYEHNGVQQNTWHVYKYNESSGQFEKTSVDPASIMPDWNSTDYEIQSSPTYQGWIHLRRVMRFNGRTYYLVHSGWSFGHSMGGFSATCSDDGTISATRINLNSGKDHPVDWCVVNGTLYIMTQQKVNSSGVVVHCIYSSTDGANFTKVATFNVASYASSMSYVSGYFYIGFGRATSSGMTNGEFISGDSDNPDVGKIYRFCLPQETSQVVLNQTVMTVDEGKTSPLQIRLSAAPVSNVTVRVILKSENHDLTVSPETVTFTTSNWDTYQTVNVGVPEDNILTIKTGTIVFGTGTHDCTDAGVVVTPVNNDAPPAADDPVLASATHVSLTVSQNVTSIGAPNESAELTFSLYADSGLSDLVQTLSICAVSVAGAASSVFTGLSPATTYYVRSVIESDIRCSSLSRSTGRSMTASSRWRSPGMTSSCGCSRHLRVLLRSLLGIFAGDKGRQLRIR